MKKEDEVEVAVAPPPPRDYLRSRMAERYPDDNFDDDEAFFGRLRDDIDGYEGRLKQHDEKERQLVELFNKDPKAASFLTDWSRGSDPLVLLIQQYGDDFRAVLDDPDQQERFVEARNEYVQRQAKEREMKDAAEKNLAKTLDDLDAEVAAGGYTEEQASAAFELLNNIINDGVVEKVTPETWRTMLKAVTFDGAVEQAAHEGEMRGRNAKINDMRSKRTVPENMPASLSSGAATPPTEQTRFLGALDRGIQPDIFERGNPRRTNRKQ